MNEKAQRARIAVINKWDDNTLKKWAKPFKASRVILYEAAREELVKRNWTIVGTRWERIRVV